MKSFDFSTENTPCLSLYVQRPPLFLLLFLWVLIAISFIAPVVGLVFYTYLNSAVGMIISFVIFWGTAFYLSKYLLWNAGGSEVILITAQSIVYRAHYIYFRGKQKQINREDARIEVIPVADTPDLATLHITNTRQSIQTVAKLPTSDLREAVSEVESV